MLNCYSMQSGIILERNVVTDFSLNRVAGLPAGSDDITTFSTALTKQPEASILKSSQITQACRVTVILFRFDLSTLIVLAFD